jgi:hypothetical protein
VQKKTNSKRQLVTSKTNKMRIGIFLSVVVFVVGCQGNDKAKTEKDSGNGKDNVLVEKKDSLKEDKPKEALTFLDSILKKYELSVDQIRAHTKIDSNYYSDIYANAVFKGEAIVDFKNGYKGAIIDYGDGRNCLYKFLLIINPVNNINTDNEIIYTDCDRDESSGYRFIRYKLLNDPAFETSEYYIPANAGDDSSKVEVHKIKWRVGQGGLIDSIPYK